MKSFGLPLLLAAFGASSVYGHAVITAVVGANGVTGTGFGLVASTPRTGTDEQPFQTDTAVLKNLIADPCGHTLAGGSINIAQSLAAAETAGVPSLASDLSVTMNLHQINGDGGGPFTAMFNTDGTGLSWAAAKVLVQVPGQNGLLAGGPFESKFVAQLPTGTTCTGGTTKNVCLVRISNGGSAADGAGPFGGCVAVTNPNTAVAATGTIANSTVAAAAAAAASTVTAKATAKGAKTATKTKKVPRAEVEELFADLMKRVINLSPADANDLITAAGSALNIPIDALAGLNDDSPTGGNSTAPAAGAILTKEQAVNLQEAVKDAVSKAIEMMATGLVTPTAGAVATQVNAANPDLAITANEAMSTSFAEGLATRISVAVGQPDGTAVLAASGATATAVAASTTRAKGVAATATATAAAKNKNATGSGAAAAVAAAKKAKAAKAAKAAQAATAGNAAAARPRVRSRVMGRKVDISEE